MLVTLIRHPSRETGERQRKNNSSTSDAPKVRRGFSLKINYEYSLDLTSQIAAHLTWFLCLVSWPDLTVNRTDGLPWWRWSGTSTAACFSFWGTLAVAGFSLALTAALFRALRIPWYPRLFAAMPLPHEADSALLNAHAYKARVLLSHHHVLSYHHVVRTTAKITIHINLPARLSYSSTDLPLYCWPLLQLYEW